MEGRTIMRRRSDGTAVGGAVRGTVARWAAVIVLSAVVALLAVDLLRHDDERIAAAPTRTHSAESSPPKAAVPAETAINSRTAVRRLEEIFEIQDRAFRERDETLLRSIFAPDCPCFAAGTYRIRTLRADVLRWVGYRSRVSGAVATRTDARTWSVNATVRAAPTRVETDSRELLRLIPPERLRWTFVLTEPPDGGPLLLLDAEAAP
jgi:hypothetical protein